ITNIDPIKYNLLFERFLNPDRKSMPDIDTDFDDEGRQKVIDYVVNKYGQSQVAHIVTYGTMAAKMSIKDVSRVLDLPLDRANALAKLVPEKPGIELDRVINAPLEGEKSLKEKENLGPEDIENAKKLRDIAKGNSQEAQVLHEALILEGSVRGTGIHAAGIIIAPKDLTEIIPVCASKDTHLYITQYEGSIIEDAGVIKMDFLGLKTLTIIKEALRLIKQNHGVEISIDEIPLDDQKTYELYQRGETNGTFQFESAGMQKYLRELKPDKFDDLIAMNALYRPGPIEYIPDFIARKHGRQAVAYDLPDMEEYLKETYGICTYQEQVMLLSQKLAGFSKGDADVLRKAMGKKQIAVLNKMKGQFIEGGKARNYPENKLEKIWTDWEAFASYAFNKSHSTCYAFVAYQTAYLKAHYPGEYMAAVMTNNQGNIDKITFFMEECRRMGVPVKGPDVNESDDRFSVNKKGEIRFALSAIKGVGSNVVQEIIRQRGKDGPFATIFEFAKRMPPGTANRKTVEALAYAGALDCFGIERYMYFLPASDKDETIFLEKALSFGRKSQQEALSPQASLFGDIGNTTSSPPPQLPKVSITDGIVNEAWSELERLNYERDVIGLYLSGHPLDKWKWQIQSFTNCKLSEFRQTRSKDIRVAGIVRNLQERVSRKGNRFLTFVLEDFSDSGEVSLFGDQYEKFRGLLRNDEMIFISASGQPGRFDPTETDLRINDIRLL
ncbi:MAG: DNA polymerase III subunit alpha, partial [Bacteroidetes bacterium]